jgi:hypothetical protein
VEEAYGKTFELVAVEMKYRAVGVVVAATPPVALVERSAFWILEMVRLEVEAVEEKRFVAVRAVEDAYGSVLAEVEVTVMVPVAVRLPPKKVLPETSRRLVGEVVPIPKDPVPVRRAHSVSAPEESVEKARSARPTVKFCWRMEVKALVVVAAPDASLVRNERRGAEEVAEVAL